MPADLMAINDVDWVPSLKMGAEESQPVAKPVVEIPYREHKDHDYCAAPGTPLKTLNQHFNIKEFNFKVSDAQPDENDIQFVDIESEQDEFTPAMDEDEDVLAITPDFISPDLLDDPPPSCSSQDCLNEKNRLRSQLHEKIAAHYVTQTELEAVRRELDGAKEQLAVLRAQLEENTHALCAYLSAGGNRIIMKPIPKSFTLNSS